MQEARQLKQKEFEELTRKPLVFVLIIVVGVPLIICFLLYSIMIGSLGLSISQVWDIIWAGKTSDAENIIVHDVRIPRALSGVLVGAALGVAGAVMQALTRNPLADPSIFGVSQGSMLAIAIGMAFLPGITSTGVALFSFIGAGIGVFLVYIVGAYSKGGLSPAKLALAGTAIGMLLSSFATIISLQFDIAKDITYWYAGGLVGVEWSVIKVIAPFCLFGLVAVLLISKPLTMLSFGDEVAVGLGTKVGLTKAIGNICVLLLTGAAVSIVGFVGFVGLIVPHIARFLVGTDYRMILPSSAVLGALLVVIADILARTISPPYEVPISVLTTFVGVPFFVYLASKSRRESI